MLRTADLTDLLDTARGQYGLVSHRQARDHGVDDTGVHLLLRRREWAAALPGVYAVRPVLEGARPDPLRRAATAARLAVGPSAVVCGTTAARMWGMRGLPPWDGRTVHVSVPAALRPPALPGVRAHHWSVARSETADLAGIRLTRPDRTLRDAVLALDRATAVCLMDSAVSAGLLRWRELDAQPALCGQRPGGAASRGWWLLADPRARSPEETRIRLACADAGLCPDGLYHPLHLPGQAVLFAPLWWACGAVADPCGFLAPEERALLGRARPDVRFVEFTAADLIGPAGIVRAAGRVLGAVPV
ncbi:hypothetical protein GCM10027440_44990 [Nocardiopsis coralliicola]